MESSLTNDPLQAAIDIHVGFRQLLQEYEEFINKKTIIMTLPFLHSNSMHSISSSVKLMGSLRSFDEKLTLEVKSKFQLLCEKVCEAQGVLLDIKLNTNYPCVFNSSDKVERVAEIAKKVYGEDNVTEEGLPLMASEDFGYYTRHKPGVFFFPTTGKTEDFNAYLHEPTYIFDDEAIEKASELFYRIALDRLGLKQ